MKVKPLLHRIIVLISLIVILISIVAIIAGVIIDTFSTVVFAFLLCFSLIAIISSYAIKYQDIKKVRIIARYSLYVLPAFIILTAFTPFESLFYPVLMFITVLLATAAMIYVFLYTSAESLSGVIILLIISIISIFLKRNHIFFSGVILSTSTMLISAGCFMFGIRCLNLSEKNKYFRNVTFIGCCILSVAFLGQLFKLQHWIGAGFLLAVGFSSLIIGTLYLLITLHSSGYIDWQPSFKGIFRKILIPWAFIFLLYISRFMVPELNALIFSPNPKLQELNISEYGFGMKDYTVGEKK
jgi:hypothetical protein